EISIRQAAPTGRRRPVACSTRPVARVTRPVLCSGSVAPARTEPILSWVSQRSTAGTRSAAAAGLLLMASLPLVAAAQGGGDAAPAGLQGGVYGAVGGL